MDFSYIVIVGLVLTLALLAVAVVGRRFYQAPARRYRRRLRREDRAYAALMARRLEK